MPHPGSPRLSTYDGVASFPDNGSPPRVIRADASGCDYTLYPARDLSAQFQQDLKRRRARAPRGGKSGQGTGGTARLVRLIPAVVAAYELRYLVLHLVAFAAVLHGAGSRSVTLSALVLLTAGAGLFLRESGRGLAASVPRPGWSLRFAGSWMLCSAALAALFVAAGLFHALPTIGRAQPLARSVLAGMWSAAPAVLLVGLVLAASLYGARWLLLELVQTRQRLGDVRTPGLALCAASVDRRPATAPLRAGWSDRGPPTAALATF